jgi:cytochrome c553
MPRATRCATWIVAWCGAALCSTALADDISAGRAKAQACAVCHGPLGVSTHPQAPNLAGQPADYLRAQLRAYRSGARQNEMMTLMAKPLSNDDIDQLSAWFSALRIEATAPP